MHVSQTTSLAGLWALEQDWNRLAAGNPFRTFPWLVTWWESYGDIARGDDRNRLFVLVVYDDEDETNPIAITPWYIQQHWLLGRVVRFLGSGEVCSEYLSVLCQPGRESEVAAYLAEWLNGPGAAEWDALNLADTADSDPFIRAFASSWEAAGNTVCQIIGDGCWKLDLPKSWDAYLATLSKSHRKQVRRLQRQMLDSGRVQHRRVTDRDELATAIATFLQLHQRRRSSLGKNSSLASAQFTNFLETVSERMFDLGMLRLDLIELDGRTIATDYNLAGDGVVYGFQSGMDPEAIRQGPGTLLTLAMIRVAIGEGYQGYDLLRGNESYKSRWGAQLQETLAVRIAGNSRIARLRHRAWSVLQSTDRCARRAVGILRRCPAMVKRAETPDGRGDRKGDVENAKVVQPPRPTNRPRLRVERLATLDQVAAIETQWNDLAGDSPMGRFDWLVTWWRHFGDPGNLAVGKNELFVLAIRDDESNLIGLAPWYLCHGAAHGDVIRFLGSGMVCSDYLTVHCQPKRERDVSKAICNFLDRESDVRWALLELTGVDQQDAMVHQLGARFKSRGHTVHNRPAESCWRVDLPDSWEAYLASLSSGKRKRARRAVRELFDTQRATLHVAQSEDEVRQAFDILRELHQKRRTSMGDPGCFAEPSFASFLRDVCERLHRSGHLELSWLELNGDAVAAKMDLKGGDVIYGYQGGLDPAALGTRPGPGNLINLARIRRGIDRGRCAIDFLRGDEPYKLDWQATRRPMMEYRIVPARSIDLTRHRIWLGTEAGKRWTKTVWRSAKQFQMSAMVSLRGWRARCHWMGGRAVSKG